MLDKISDRIKEYEQAIEKSAAQHNSLVGGLNELRSLLELAKKDHKDIEEVVYTAEE